MTTIRVKEIHGEKVIIAGDEKVNFDLFVMEIDRIDCCPIEAKEQLKKILNLLSFFNFQQFVVCGCAPSLSAVFYFEHSCVSIGRHKEGKWQPELTLGYADIISLNTTEEIIREVFGHFCPNNAENMEV